MAVIRTGGSSPKRPPKASKTPTKKLPQAKSTNVKYGGGAVSVYTQPKASPKTTQAAVTRWNNQVPGKKKVFRTVDSPKKADVVVKVSPSVKSASATGSPGAYSASGKGKVLVNPLTAKVARKPGSKSQRQATTRAYQHELGHTVGLAHPGSRSDPYMNHGGLSSKRSRGSGIMGSGKRANVNEVKTVKALRFTATQKAQAKKAVGRAAGIRRGKR